MTDIEKYRSITFIFITILLIALERLFMRRKRPSLKGRRIFNNYLLFGVDVFLLKLIVPLGVTGVSYWGVEKEIGLFVFLKVTTWLNIILSVLTLDLIIYWQHRIFHKIPIFWRIHRVHHTDRFIDVSSGVRFHPFEIGVSFLIKSTFVLLVGMNPLGVLFFEVLLNSMSLFSHANLKIYPTLDRTLRRIIITPSFHEIHHSDKHEEMNSNFGFNFILWDKIFRSFSSEKKKGFSYGVKDSREESLKNNFFLK